MKKLLLILLCLPLLFSSCSDKEKEAELEAKIIELSTQLDECENGSGKLLAAIEIADKKNNNTEVKRLFDEIEYRHPESREYTLARKIYKKIIAEEKAKKDNIEKSEYELLMKESSELVGKWSEYELMKESSELVGKWIMEWTFGNQDRNFLIEFYNKDGEYFEVWLEDNPTIKKLVKEKNKYLREKKGHYYIIKESGDLTAYDQQGYIGEEYGFRYITIN